MQAPTIKEWHIPLTLPVMGNTTGPAAIGTFSINTPLELMRVPWKYIRVKAYINWALSGFNITSNIGSSLLEVNSNFPTGQDFVSDQTTPQQRYVNWILQNCASTSNGYSFTIEPTTWKPLTQPLPGVTQLTFSVPTGWVYNAPANTYCYLSFEFTDSEPVLIAS